MNRYNNLNGFRAFCAIGIALMHILANISPTPHFRNCISILYVISILCFFNE